jgi:Endonuclease/Exonuclease/phosphatase family
MDDRTYCQLRISSYNCHGYNDTKTPYMRHLLEQCDFLFMQEHWLSDSQLHVFNNLCNTHVSHGSCGFDNTDVLSGRPYGGCAIFWRVYIKAQVFFVQINNKRICSIRVCNEIYKLLLSNVYMPYESDIAAEEEFSSVLADVLAIIDQFEDYCFVLGGDFNVDFNKHKSHARLLRDVCEEN